MPNLVVTTSESLVVSEKQWRQLYDMIPKFKMVPNSE